MTSDELKHAAELASAAIDAPWTVRRGWDRGGDAYTVLDGNGMWVAQCGADKKSAAFIAASRELVPALVAECVALRKSVDDLDALLSTERHDNAEAQRNLEAQRDAAMAECERLKGRLDWRKPTGPDKDRDWIAANPTVCSVNINAFVRVLDERDEAISRADRAAKTAEAVALIAGPRHQMHEMKTEIARLAIAERDAAIARAEQAEHENAAMRNSTGQVSREVYDADIATMQMRVDYARKGQDDLRAQLAACEAELKRVGELFEVKSLRRSIDEVREKAERDTAEAIAHRIETANDSGALSDVPRGWRLAIAADIRSGAWRPR